MITATPPVPSVSAAARHDPVPAPTTIVSAAVGVVLSLGLVLDAGTTVGVARVVTPASAPDTPCPGAPPHAAC
jgi:hypothetical protein